MREIATCEYCGNAFDRQANQKYPMRYCKSEKCREVKRKRDNFKAMFKKDSEPIDWSMIPSSNLSKDRSDIAYHGKPNL